MPVRPFLVALAVLTASAVWTAPAALAHDDRCPSAGQTSSGSGRDGPGPGGGDRDGGDRDGCRAVAPQPAAAPAPGVAPAAVPEPGMVAQPGGDTFGQDVPASAESPQPPDGQPAAPHAGRMPAAGAAAAAAPGSPAWTLVAGLAMGLGLVALIGAGVRARREIVRGLDARWPRA